MGLTIREDVGELFSIPLQTMAIAPAKEQCSQNLFLLDGAAHILNSRFFCWYQTKSGHKTKLITLLSGTSRKLSKLPRLYFTESKDKFLY